MFGKKQHEKDLATVDRIEKIIEKTIEERNTYRRQRNALARALSEKGHDPKSILRDALKETQTSGSES